MYLISTHTPLAGRDFYCRTDQTTDIQPFLLTRPLRDVTVKRLLQHVQGKISTHTPLAGRDQLLSLPVNYIFLFLLTRPLRDVTSAGCYVIVQIVISTHTPLAGRDDGTHRGAFEKNISTHTPLAGRDHSDDSDNRYSRHFYSHAPCGT